METRPDDWEKPNVDLRNFIGKVNAVKRRYRIFQEECPTNVLPYHNPNVLLLWKASTTRVNLPLQETQAKPRG